MSTPRVPNPTEGTAPLTTPPAQPRTVTPAPAKPAATPGTKPMAPEATVTIETIKTPPPSRAKAS